MGRQRPPPRSTTCRQPVAAQQRAGGKAPGDAHARGLPAHARWSKPGWPPASQPARLSGQGPSWRWMGPPSWWHLHDDGGAIKRPVAHSLTPTEPWQQLDTGRVAAPPPPPTHRGAPRPAKDPPGGVPVGGAAVAPRRYRRPPPRRPGTRRSASAPRRAVPPQFRTIPTLMPDRPPTNWSRRH